MNKILHPIRIILLQKNVSKLIAGDKTTNHRIECVRRDRLIKSNVDINDRVIRR